MTVKDEKTATDGKEAPENKGAGRVLAKTMWQLENDTKFENADARKEAFAAVKKEYNRKAKRMMKVLGKKGVSLVIEEKS